MEHEQFDSQKDNMQLDSYALEYLRETAKWAKFLAIIGFVSVGIIILFAVFVFFAIPKFSILIIAVCAFASIPTYYLYRFSIEVKEALYTNDTYFLSHGLKHLKSLFRFQGIITIITIALYTLGFLYFYFIEGYNMPETLDELFSN